MWHIWILYLVASNTCILYDMNNLQSVYTFPLEKKGKRIIHSLYWKFKDNIDLENQQKLSRQYYLQSKIYTKYILSSWSSWCILSNETSNTVFNRLL